MPRLARRALPMLAASLAAPAFAQTYPDRTITLVVPFLAGGSTDIAARILAERMSAKLGPQARIVVENRAGAGGSVGSEWVRHRPADGYTLLLASASALGTNPAALPQQTPYDPVADFTQIAVIGGGPIVLVVPAQSPFRSAQELLEAVKARPGHYSWATSGAGGIGHLTGEAIKVAYGGLRAEHVPYRGGSAVMEALAKGEVDYSLEVLASTAPHIRDGLSRGLAVSSLRRHPLFPDIPSLDEVGLSGFEITTWNLLVAPRGLPEPLAAQLSAAANAVLAEPAAAERMAAAGVDPAAPSTPASSRDFLLAEVAKFKGIVEKAGLRLGRG
ncbi:tripartite tricarboxylate transporter substrate binding protein [Siccirubricoccus sp. KC 17139]|uniref:Tripartite tricarboxylate transporter substrate binding protein n=1 Tax=Siccirubricoccus soli TaxID=2899147 RepID=A0ABT1D679_9PROT|nr:tripartite tricarboxylate transporter substrate binding protein [Siccirubricoccus soli]MCO6417448.1 tripartite tricarboxylate transporter substrate binding protein [Siccirubricoccus soli]MCP2683583.1 tripartite tricarboxylate transporter substrate binding protein [Siccirubricoccus soli]